VSAAHGDPRVIGAPDEPVAPRSPGGAGDPHAPAAQSGPHPTAASSGAHDVGAVAGAGTAAAHVPGVAAGLGDPQAPAAPEHPGAPSAPAATGGAEALAAPRVTDEPAAKVAQPAVLWPSTPTIDNPPMGPPAAPYAPGTAAPAAPYAPGMPGPGGPVTGAPLFGPETTGPQGPGFGAPGAAFGPEVTGAPLFGGPPQPSRPRRRGRWIALGAVAVLVIVAGTVGGVLWVSHRDADAEPSAGASPKPMKPKQYKEWLASVDATLAPLYKQVVEASTAADIKRTVTAAAEATRLEREKFGTKVPPVKAERAHAQLGSALTYIADDLAQVAASELCSTNTARAVLGKGTGADAVRTGVTDLAASDPGAGYTVGTFLPQATEVKTERPADGTLLKTPAKVRGGGDFAFENNTGSDYVVVIVEGGTRTAVGAVYLQSGAGRATIADVGSRTFNLYLQSGTDWDDAGGGFLKNCRTTRWKKDFDLKEFDWTIRPPGPAAGSENIEVIPVEEFPTFR
jgi:hypothetical protein